MRKWENGKNSLENGRSKFWFRIYCYYYWGWIDTPHYFINRHAEEKLQKSGRLDVYNLVQESNLVEFKISSEVFTETFFFFLIENESVMINTLQICECLSLSKENF